jgi:hypothetical protein
MLPALSSFLAEFVHERESLQASVKLLPIHLRRSGCQAPEDGKGFLDCFHGILVPSQSSQVDRPANQGRG